MHPNTESDWTGREGMVEFRRRGRLRSVVGDLVHARDNTMILTNTHMQDQIVPNNPASLT